MTESQPTPQQPATDLTQQIDQLLQQRLAALTPQMASPAPVVPGFNNAQMPGMQPATSPKFLLLRVKIPVGQEETGAYLGFELPDNANPQTIQAVVQQASMIYPVETFQPRPQNNWGGNGGGYRGGYGQRGGYGGRRW